MSDPIGPVRRAQSPRRAADRRRTGRRTGDQAVDVAPAPEPAPPRAAALPAIASQPAASKTAAASLSAQLLGQGGQKRGLRGGAETLGSARAAYLGAEYLGTSDRRTAKGRITKTDV